MFTQLKVIHGDTKGKWLTKVQGATEELQYLINFILNISFAMVKTMQHLSVLVIIKMTNIVLVGRDVYLHLKFMTFNTYL